jgi:hypothetical protein
MVLNMEPAWNLSWAWGLGVIALTIAMHAFGIAILARAAERITARPDTPERLHRHPMTRTTCAVGFVGWMLAASCTASRRACGPRPFSGWARSARRGTPCCIRSIRSPRGASGLVLNGEWRMLGAL